MNTTDILLTARHEAAHAIVADALGLTLTAASIKPDDTSLGRVEWSPGDERPEDTLIVMFAGHEACSRTAESYDLSWLDNGSVDNEQARALALEMNARTGANPTALLDQARERATELVERFWPAIERLADSLLECGALDGTDLRRALNEARETTMRPKWYVGDYQYDTSPAGRERLLTEMGGTTAAKPAARHNTPRRRRGGNPAHPPERVGYIAIKTGVVTYDGDSVTITAGRDRVAHDCALVRDHPEFFAAEPA